MSRYEIDRETSDKAERLANKLNRKVNDTVLSRHRAPNGGYYEQNDIDYLLSNGYSEEAALDELAKSEKYRRRAGSAESGRAGGARAAAGRDAGYGGSGGRTDGRGNGQKCTKAMLGDAAAAAGLSVPAYAAYMGYEIVTEEEYEIYMESTEYVEFELIDDSDIDWEEIDEDDIDFDDYEDVDDDDEYEEDGNEEDYEDDGEDGCEDEDEDVEEEEEYEEEDYEEDGDEEDYEEDGGDEEGDCDEE